jgi:Ankyrin repeat
MTRKRRDAGEAWLALFDDYAKPTTNAVRAACKPAVIDAQDRWGMTAAMLCVAYDWPDVLDVVLERGPDLDKRYRRTGETALHLAAQNRNAAIATRLVKAGANADAGNYWGVTPRALAPSLFARVRKRRIAMPAPQIQNAELLAEHFGRKFSIAKRAERESLAIGQAVDLIVYGPKSERIKVRIFERDGAAYTARLDPPDQPHNLAPGTTEVTFGPEHVVTVWLKQK